MDTLERAANVDLSRYHRKEGETAMPQLEEVITALQDAVKRKLWGQVQIDFQDGEATVLRVSETRKLSTAKENNPRDTNPRYRH